MGRDRKRIHHEAVPAKLKHAVTLNTIVSGGEQTCPICGKVFWAYADWVYKTGYKYKEKFYCSYNHMRQAQAEKEEGYKPTRDGNGNIVCRYCGALLVKRIERCTWCRRKIIWDTRRK